MTTPKSPAPADKKVGEKRKLGERARPAADSKGVGDRSAAPSGRSPRPKGASSSGGSGGDGIPRLETSGAVNVNTTYRHEDHAMLVRVVRELQKRGSCGEGSEGDFPTFIKKTQPSSYKSRSYKDPAKHPAQVLGSFVDSCKSDKVSKIIKRHMVYEEYNKRLLSGATKFDPQRHKLKLAESDRLGVLELVYKTQTHADYTRLYNLPSYHKHWRVTGWTAPAKLSAEARAKYAPRLLAMDCEMCETTKGARELLGVTVTDEEGNAVLRTLVKPRGEIKDLKTDITGITAEDLKDVTTTCHDVQRRIEKLCKEGGGAVLVGHSLNHDLMALRLEHRLLIDTALIFQYTGLDKCTPSLADLAERVLNRPIRVATTVHDSAEDAAASMALVQHVLKHGMQPIPPPSLKVSKEDQKRLFMHRLPINTTEADVIALFQNTEGSPVPVGVVGLERNKKEGKSSLTANVEFGNIGDANMAFKKLACFTRTMKDTRGRPQKDVVFRDGNTAAKEPPKIVVMVRKHACHGGEGFSQYSAGPKSGDSTVAQSPSRAPNKRQKKLV